MRNLASVFLVMLMVSMASAEAPKKEEPKKEEMGPADAAKVEKFVDAWIDAMVKNTSDCPKMGKEMNALIDANEAWLIKMAESGKEVPAPLKEKFKKKAADMMDALTKCKDDKGVTGAFERFSKIDKKKKAADAKK